MYNLFRYCGDFMHLASIMILLFKIRSRKNCTGISLKSQQLYALVFITRYLDLFHSSWYNMFMKIIFISSSIYIVYLIMFVQPICATYNKSMDEKLRIEWLCGICTILAIIRQVLISDYDVIELLWSFSIWLESLAILPQLMVVHEYAKNDGGFVENLTSHYVFTLGGYRFMYILNWIWRRAADPTYSDWESWIAGIVQTVIYCDFFFYYLKAWKSGGRTRLPM
mmetsp:Transcript_26798/g.37089  ORF Transcript_26798/g.37089 Transcript_26798/m.37089 type:complete len:224 (-) Transcript_26798:156-827(-)